MIIRTTILIQLPKKISIVMMMSAQVVTVAVRSSTGVVNAEAEQLHTGGEVGTGGGSAEAELTEPMVLDSSEDEELHDDISTEHKSQT